MPENNSTPNDIAEVESLLAAELDKVRADNRRSLTVGVVIAVIIALYLGWAGSQAKKLFDPEGIALAATGVAMDAVPQAGQSMRDLLVKGAPDLARAASQKVVDMLPTFRQVMEDEMSPVIDEVTGILAQKAVSEMVASTGANEAGDEQLALQAGADAVVTRLDALLVEALDEPMEQDGPTPRQSIEESLAKLQVIDRELKRMARGHGSPQEREMLLTWLNLVGQFQETADASAQETYRSGVQVED